MKPIMKKITTCILFLFTINALQAQVDPAIFDKFESKRFAKGKTIIQN